MKSTATTTLKRAGAAVALSAALLSATGCGYIYQQPTTIVYSASDGVMQDLATLKLRNIMVISSGSSEPGRLLGTVLNTGDSDATLEIAFPSGTKTVNVPANSEIRFEEEKNKVVLSSTGAAPGMVLKGVKTSAAGQKGELDIPVLDGTLEDYRPYLPNAAESAQASQSSTAAQTPSSASF